MGRSSLWTRRLVPINLDNEYGEIVKILIIPFFLSALAITGCTQSVPKCSADETTSLVKQITKDEMLKQYGTEATEQFSYTLSSIRTTNTNEQTGAHECAAEIDIASSNTGSTINGAITYTVEMTDDGENFYVNVFGL